MTLSLNQFDIRHSTFDIPYSTFDIPYSTFDIPYKNLFKAQTSVALSLYALQRQKARFPAP